MHALAQNHAAQGDLPAAIARFTRTVDLRRRHLGPTHGDTVASEAALNAVLDRSRSAAPASRRSKSTAKPPQPRRSSLRN